MIGRELERISGDNFTIPPEPSGPQRRDAGPTRRVIGAIVAAPSAWIAGPADIRPPEECARGVTAADEELIELPEVASGVTLNTTGCANVRMSCHQASLMNGHRPALGYFRFRRQGYAVVRGGW